MGSAVACTSTENKYSVSKHQIGTQSASQNVDIAGSFILPNTVTKNNNNITVDSDEQQNEKTRESIMITPISIEHVSVNLRLNIETIETASPDSDDTCCNDIYSPYSPYCSNFPSSLLDSMDSKISDHSEFLASKGYTIRKKVQNTLQGELFEAINNTTHERVAIKRTNKMLHTHRICMDEDGYTELVDENIVKEAILLRHLTVYNKAIADYICRYHAFYESESDYYLIMEFAGECTLHDFTLLAHEYMKCGKLSVKNWMKTVKFIFWQLSTLFYWMHHDMHVAHLDLTMKNIVLQSSSVGLSSFFVENNDGQSVSINPDITVKLVDFGNAEAFQETFNCEKWAVTEKHSLKSPQVFAEGAFDASKADVWSMGVILFRMLLGCDPYQYQDCGIDPQFRLISNSKILKLIKVSGQKHLLKCVHVLELLQSLLNINEYERCNVEDILRCKWFVSYFKRYQERIENKSKSQKLKQMNQCKDKNLYKDFPYYH